MIPPHLLDDPDLIVDDNGVVVGRHAIARGDPFGGATSHPDAITLPYEPGLDSARLGLGHGDQGPIRPLEAKASHAGQQSDTPEARDGGTQLAQMSGEGKEGEYDILQPGPWPDWQPGRDPRFGGAVGLGIGAWLLQRQQRNRQNNIDRTDMADPPPPKPGFEGEAPNIDAAPGRPADPEAAGGDTLIYPDGATLPAHGSPPPLEDQSDVLPQGTILNIRDKDGNEFNIDVSNSSTGATRKLRRHLNQIPDDKVRGVVQGLTDGGALTTAKGAGPKASEITQSGQEDPAASGKQAFDDIVRGAGGDPTSIQPIPEDDGSLRWEFNLVDEDDKLTGVVEMRVGSSQEGHPTNEVQILRPGARRKNPYFKIRYTR
jgi:hypothetical protein